MNSFLEYVATDILAKYGTDLSRTAVVFPNKRASLFLNDALARQAGEPLWSPAYITISELFRQYSPLQVADPLKLVCELYNSYIRQTGFDETLDHFYGWGQLLLADFDDIDKNMAPADPIFANLRDIHELDDVSYLTDSQREVIQRFFANFTEDHNTQLKERFLRLWSRLADIYHDFNQSLAAQQLAYEGALYREVASSEDLSFDYDRYLFVGFNMLQQVEQRLFTTLRRQQKAFFYWDYDQYYLGTEAGHYISQYLERFPNELPSTLDEAYDRFRQPKDITFVAAPTEDIQARYISQWLSREQDGHRPRIEAGRRTAIVLCNEGLLPTVIHGLPDAVAQVNITTGFPLQQTPVSTLVQQLIQLQTLGYDPQRRHYRLRYVSAVLRHPYAHYISPDSESLAARLNEQHVYYPGADSLAADEGLALLFATPCDTNGRLLHWLTDVTALIARQSAAGEAASPFDAEALFRMYTLLNRLSALVDGGDLGVDTLTLQRLIGQIVQQTTIPFHGEPAVGLQVMGVLETRNLDFDHLLVLSCGEGYMPRGVSDSSFIPYSLRRAFSLTTIDHKVAIYAYYFHRLLARAKDVTLVYNATADDRHTGEMSRFMLQLLIESPHPVRQLTLQSALSTQQRRPRAVEKTEAVLASLQRRFTGQALSPTAISHYLRCQLQFYYRYAEGLMEPDETNDLELDNRVFGNIFHTAAQLLYQRLARADGTVTIPDIDRLLKTRADIERCVDEAFSQEFFKSTFKELSGLQIIHREAVIHYLRQLLTIDRRLAPLRVLQLEGDVYTTLPTSTSTSNPVHANAIPFPLTIGGRIDRLDQIVTPDGREQIRVIDYKTGSRRLRPLPDVEAVFDPKQVHNHSDYYLQALLYARIVSQRHPHTAVAPALLFIQHAGADDYDPVLCFGNERIRSVNSADGLRFDALLTEKVGEMFDPARPFLPTDDEDICRTCPYRLLCAGRN
jgi:CRISPR/Cas system-associated exonuclease Cas4 (RecB family)